MNKKGAIPFVLIAVIAIIAIFGALIYTTSTKIDEPLQDREEILASQENTSEFNLSEINLNDIVDFDKNNTDNNASTITAILIPSECNNLLTRIDNKFTIWIGTGWCKLRNIFYSTLEYLGMDILPFMFALFVGLLILFIFSTGYATMTSGGAKGLTWVMWIVFGFFLLAMFGIF